eukprot:TRINITY_DN5168_c0_g1_i4.p2 TRINITY_DN5168_c0_g1~~TRINITY_DN5168_c0_g1_i4.p2  ORF type:complete len:226 (+),score=68.22 TRINITY_DN5168_c0_g1_i4:65-742(+)
MTVQVATVPSKKSFDEIAGLEGYSPCLQGAARLLMSLVAKGDHKLKGARPTDDDSLMYNGVEPAPVSVQDYLIRLFKYGLATPEVYVHMVVYMGRFRSRTSIEFHSYNIHRLMLTAFTIAAKLRDDVYYSNKYYAKIGGIAVDDLNRMEHAFLTHCNWELFVSEEEHAMFTDALMDAQRAPSHTPTTPKAPLPKSNPFRAVKNNVLSSLRKLSQRSNGSSQCLST